MRVWRMGALACAVGLSLAVSVAPAYAETSQDVWAEVADVQAELDTLVAQIDEGEARVQSLQTEVEGLAQESIELQGQLISDRAKLSEIISSSYKDNADARTLALLLSSRSIDELISQIHYAQKVSDWEADCIEQLNEDREQLADRMDQINQAKEEQQATLAELDAQRDSLDEKIGELSTKAEMLEEAEREAARKAAEEAERKAEEERKAKEAREAEERARQEAIEAAKQAGDIESGGSSEASGGSTSGGSSSPAPSGDWITCIASAYTIADNDPPGSTATASGIPLDESVPTVAMPMSMSPSRFYGSQIQIEYNGITVVATVTDCGYMGGGSRGLDLTPAIFRAFGFSSADSWGLREVHYRFL